MFGRGLYTDPLGSPQERSVEGGREVAPGLDPRIYDRSPPPV